MWPERPKRCWKAKTMSKRKIVILCFLILLVLLIIWIWHENKALTMSTYTVLSEKLPNEFIGFRIAHVSDLHNAQMGRGNEKLLSMLRNSAPDMIAITGDMIDSRRTNMQVALQFAEEAVRIAPCYYVTGNHEARIDECNAFKASLTNLGITVLEDESLLFEHYGQAITLIGVEDPSFQTDCLFGDAASVMDDKLSEIDINTDSFKLLLSHRPELFQAYADKGMDLVLTGHAHGGQFRLPLIGGLYAPNQGFFPEYDAGHYSEGNTQMIVSRGIGNSLFPIRFNNRPEFILIELTTAKTSD